MPKLVTVTRSDLTIAQQAVQSTHAAIDFIFEHPSRASPWHKESQYLVCLAVNTEQQLEILIEQCNKRFIAYSVFREADLDNQITAIALEPGIQTQKLVSRIPLMFKNINNESI